MVLGIGAALRGGAAAARSSGIVSRIGSTLSGSSSASGAAGLGLGSVFGDVTNLSPIDIFPGTDGPSTGGGDGGGIFGNMSTILYVAMGIALLAVVADLMGD